MSSPETASTAGQGGNTPIDPTEVIQGNPVVDAVTEAEMIASEVQEITAGSIVKNHIIASLGVGLVPIPLFDVSALTAVQISLLRSLGAHYGVPVRERELKPLLFSLLGGATPVMAIAGLSSFAKLMPGIGSLAGSAGLSVLAGAIAYAVGQTFILHFEAGGTLEDFDPKAVQAFFRRELEAGKRVVQDIRSEINGTKRNNARTSTS
ncbi:MAG: DUF697 domain-containing protein [Candidatus Thiothrix singaporensis]|uniref:DUF697 domain-containing protein n=1 Tax=Candidatus Thiothrix singaporensis TaxID=2799669 RepID=A0A7L6AQS6_9GAMM|nr:MAG: DUF697 domain-containing protein [Candidatus Thiothrix singaporensis]